MTLEIDLHSRSLLSETETQSLSLKSFPPFRFAEVYYQGRDEKWYPLHQLTPQDLGNLRGASPEENREIHTRREEFWQERSPVVTHYLRTNPTRTFGELYWLYDRTFGPPEPLSFSDVFWVLENELEYVIEATSLITMRRFPSLPHDELPAWWTKREGIAD